MGRQRSPRDITRPQFGVNHSFITKIYLTNCFVKINQVGRALIKTSRILHILLRSSHQTRNKSRLIYFYKKYKYFIESFACYVTKSVKSTSVVCSGSEKRNYVLCMTSSFWDLLRGHIADPKPPQNFIKYSYQIIIAFG